MRLMFLKARKIGRQSCVADCNAQAPIILAAQMQPKDFLATGMHQHWFNTVQSARMAIVSMESGRMKCKLEIMKYEL